MLNNLPPMSNPISVAEKAGLLARRRRIGKVAVFASGAALVLTIWTALLVTSFGRAMMGIDRPESSLRTVTIPLTCLSPEQAGDIINPYVRSRHSAYFVGSSGVGAITVRGTADEIAKSKDLIRQFESDRGASCRTSLADRLREMQKVLEDASAPLEMPVRPEQPERPAPAERLEPPKTGSGTRDAAPVLAPAPDVAAPAKKH
ncbi:MAG TPA: hypothetical protein VGN73_10375 [Gemmatimonadaceae bacterium]|nr:hypothetical protein [Gemmatimonadaceae bacterium]